MPQPYSAALTATHQDNVNETIAAADVNALAAHVNTLETDANAGGPLDLPGHLNAANPHPVYQLTAGKNQPNGYLGLDGSSKATLAPMQEVLSSTDLVDVIGPFGAGDVPTHTGAGGFKAGSKIFSAAAYGVRGTNLNADAAANATALTNCINAAKAAGAGALVALDWAGVAYCAGTPEIPTRIMFKGTGFNKLKLADTQAAGAHVMATTNFATLTQSVPASWDVGAYEFSILDIWLDGNKANNATGGHCLAIAGYGYQLDRVFCENAKSAGWWTEWNMTGEPLGNGGSQHQRAFRVGYILCVNNDCANVAAANTRATEARAAIAGGQACLFGPGDSYIHYIECYRNGSIAGIGFNQGVMDLTAGSFSSFNPVITCLVVWLNHSTGVYFGGGGPAVTFLHAEGATTVVNIACQGVRITNGHVFFTQPSGTEFLITSGCNGGGINVTLENSPVASATKLNITAGTCTEAELNFYLDIGSALAVTATAGALPVSARHLIISANNYAGATVTAGWLPLEPGSTTLYGLNWNRKPVLSMTGVGYTTGAGGAVTQATSKATGVTLNTLSGAITLNAASLAAATSVTFTVTDSKVAATDVVMVSIKSGATANSYQATVDAVAAGSFNVSLRNVSAGALAEAVVVNFVILKAVAA